MKNEKSNSMKRMAIVAVCVGMVGSGGLVQATNKVTPVMKTMVNVPASKIKTMPSWEDKIISVNLRDFQIQCQQVKRMGQQLTF